MLTLLAGGGLNKGHQLKDLISWNGGVERRFWFRQAQAGAGVTVGEGLELLGHQVIGGPATRHCRGDGSPLGGD